MNDKLNHPKLNIITIFIFEIIGCAITFSADYTGAGMSAIIIKWIPALIGLVTIILFVGSKLFIKKYNWLITLLGIITIIAAAIHVYSTNFTLTT